MGASWWCKLKTKRYVYFLGVFTNTYLRDADFITVLFLYEIKDFCGCFFPFKLPAAGHLHYLGFYRTVAKVLSGDNGRHNLIVLSVGALPGRSSQWTFDMIGGGRGGSARVNDGGRTRSDAPSPISGRRLTTFARPCLEAPGRDGHITMTHET